jgi:hypothetical protein
LEARKLEEPLALDPGPYTRGSKPKYDRPAE